MDPFRTSGIDKGGKPGKKISRRASSDEGKKVDKTESNERAEESLNPKRLMERHKEKIYFTTPTKMLAQKGSIQWPVPRRPREKFSQVQEPTLEPLPGFFENQLQRSSRKHPPAPAETKRVTTPSSLISSMSAASSTSLSLLESALLSEEQETLQQESFSRERLGLRKKKTAEQLTIVSDGSSAREVVLPEGTNFLLLDPKIFEEITDPVSIVHLIRKYPEIGFLYLNSSVSRSSVSFSPYKLKIVGYDKIVKDDFFTISSHGVTHYWDKEVSFTDLARWEKDYKLYLQLLTKTTFGKFRQWKAFIVWYKTVRFIITTERINYLQTQLFILQPHTRKALLEITRNKALLDLETLINIDDGKQLSLGNLFRAQMQVMNELRDELNKYRSITKIIVLNACRTTLLSAAFVPDDCVLEYPEMAANVDKSTYAEQANKRNLCIKLTRFIRLVDYLILTFKFETVRNSCAYLLSITKLQLDRYYKSLLPVVEEEVPQKSGEALEIKLDGAKTEEETPSLFSINLLLQDGVLKFEPDASTFIDTLMSIMALRQEVVRWIPNLTPDTQFEAFTRPMINWKVEEKTCGLGPNIVTVFDNDKTFKSILVGLKDRIAEAFSLADEYSNTLDTIKDFYLENEKLDVAALNSPEYGVDFFQKTLKKHRDEQTLVDAIPTSKYLGLLTIDLMTFRSLVHPSPTACLEALQNMIPTIGRARMDSLYAELQAAQSKMERRPTATQEIVEHIMFVDHFIQRIEEVELLGDGLVKLYEMIESFKIATPPEDYALCATLPPTIMTVRMIVDNRADQRQQYIDRFCKSVDKDTENMDLELISVKAECENPMLLMLKTDRKFVKDTLGDLQKRLNEFSATAEQVRKYQKHFDIEMSDFPNLDKTKAALGLRQLLWNSIDQWDALVKQWTESDFHLLDPEDIVYNTTKYLKILKQLEKGLPPNEVHELLMVKVNDMKEQMGMITDLRNPNLRTRHWDKIETALNVSFAERPLTLSLLKELAQSEEVKDSLTNISLAATAEYGLEMMLKKMEDAWKGTEFILSSHRDSRDVFILAATDDIQLLLEESITNVSTILSSRNCGPVKARTEEWDQRLKLFTKTLEAWWKVQKTWLYLENIFSAPDIQRQLPVEAKIFLTVDKQWKDIMRRTNKMPVAMHAATQPGMLESFQNCISLLEQVMKCLDAYLESKCMIFCRFFFLSNEELLEILTQGRNPMAVQPHLRKCFDGVVGLEFKYELSETGQMVPSSDILYMISSEGEKVNMTKGLKARGNVEDWLNRVEDGMRQSIKRAIKLALADYAEKAFELFVVSGHCSQAVLAVAGAMWAAKVEKILSNPIEEIAYAGIEAFEKVCFENLAKISVLVRGYLEPLQRATLGALITLDVHARDIITELVESHVCNGDDFTWLRQFRYYWDFDKDNLLCKVSNNVYHYGYEYLGASPRLVITPLTDRHYFCSLGAFTLHLGAAPAGPAGTGKTETTKDLSKAVANQCVVFNCSDGMDYIMMGRFFKGIIQTGAWACFDEFNRIVLEVLSVVAQQLISVRLAKINKLSKFMFEGVEIRLGMTCMSFITMNPGYAGRTELPDNLKALFRPISMMVPNYMLIAEVIFYSEGFEDSQNLARKMANMYRLCGEQLSKQDHYDFGMRAVKSVLVMAGALKRSQPDKTEAYILARALVDSNLPKFLAMDANIFSALMKDLFPAVELARADYGLLETGIERFIIDNQLQPHPAFIQKVIQYYDTTLVRHGIMLVGPPASAKTTCYEVLAGALTWLHKEGHKDPQYKPVHVTIMNPKSVSLPELYGEFNRSTGEWHDGILGYYYRENVQAPDKDHRWIVCDGPVDAVWVENLNSVLDDNKLLCLTNSERILLTPQIRCLYEVQDLAQASPATVSRCGMVYMDPNETGWEPYVESWLMRIPVADNEHLVNYIWDLFDFYLNDCLKFMNKYCVQGLPQVEISKVITLCRLMESIIFGKGNEIDMSLEFQKICSMMCQGFVWSLLWALGGNLLDDSKENFELYVRQLFEESADAKLPSEVDLWNLYFDFDRKRLDQWEKIVAPFLYQPSVPFYDILVPTVDTVRFSYTLEKLLAVGMPCLFSGFSGVGKSVVARYHLNSIKDKCGYVPVYLNFSAQTSSNVTQELIEAKCSKKKKGILGAPAGKKLIIFIDDVNMPKPDEYGSQPPLELLRQYLDFKGFYDRDKLNWKIIQDVILSAACAPPGGARNPLPGRFTRHFGVFFLPEPSDLRVKQIYKSILWGFLYFYPFNILVKGKCENVVDSAVEVYVRLKTDLLPTPEKAHYIFNLRDLSKCFEGITSASPANTRDGLAIYKLFVHEAQRVFHDRLINMEDKMIFHDIIAKMYNVAFDAKITAESFVEKPLIYADFLKAGIDRVDRIYEECPTIEKLKDVLLEQLLDYNLNYKEMHLVFFKDCMLHIARIVRVLRRSRGNMLLVGVGGTGKQSVTRLSAHISQCLFFQIELRRGYDHQCFYEDLRKLYNKSSIPGQDTVFMFSDTQIVMEEFVEDLNNLLNSGEIPGIYSPEDLEAIMIQMRSIVRDAGLNDNDREVVNNFFLNRCRAYIHVILCMSPIGDALRNRCRMFPSLINECTLDWFLKWPDDALLSVAQSTFKSVDFGGGTEQLRQTIPEICVTVHQSVGDIAEIFFERLRRRYYTTPTSYLELLGLFNILLTSKKKKMADELAKVETGLIKLKETSEVVIEMQAKLTELSPELESKSENVEEIMMKLIEEQEAADLLLQIVKEDEAMAKVKAEETEQYAEETKRILDEAMPRLQAALDSLDALDRSDIAEVRVFLAPPELVQFVMEAVCVLLNEEPDWATAKTILGDPGFTKRLRNYDKNHIPEATLKRLKTYIKHPTFKPETVETVSKAAKSICMWVIAVNSYAKAYKAVQPKRKKVEIAQKELQVVLTVLGEKQERLTKVEQEIDDLKVKYNESYEQKENVAFLIDQVTQRLNRASKLVVGLAIEHDRWAATAEKIKDEFVHIVGDVFVATACIAYYGAFTTEYRQELVSIWVHKARQLHIPIADDFNLVSIMVDAIEIRQWQLDGLPKDSLSTENAILVKRARRWPLLIDPQDQGNRWIRNMESKNSMVLLKFADVTFLKSLENALQNGFPVLLEDVGETIEPILEPILLKSTVKQGGQMFVRLGEKLVPYDTGFKLYMTTKLSNPHYLPEVAIKVTLINFTVTVKGLEDQLLSDCVQIERPELEISRQDLIVRINNDQKLLKQIEDTILRLLFSAEGNILDNEVLLKTLDDSKVTSNEINARLIEADKTEQMITHAREQYRTIASRGSIMYFAVSSLPELDNMYHTSLKYFNTLFNYCIESCKEGAEDEPESLDYHIQQLIQKITLAVYTNIARGLFGRHLLVYSMMLCADIMMAGKQMSREEWNLFLRGLPSVDIDVPPKPVNTSWLSEQLWALCFRLEAFVPGLAGLHQEIVTNPIAINIGGLKLFLNPRRWEGYQTADSSKRNVWALKLSGIQRLLLIKVFHEDKITAALTEFVTFYMGRIYVERPRSDLSNLYEDLSKITPLIYLLVQGSDPTESFMRFAKEKGVQERVFGVSLGQGQGPIAERRINTAILNGDWVYLQNCHVLPNWMLKLENIIKNMIEDPRPIHNNFRLFLSTLPSPGFPVSILQNSIKVTVEPPKGLRANLKGAFTIVQASFFEDHVLDLLWRRMVFNLVFFHAILQERKKFGPLGWNVKYEFNDSDRECVLLTLELFCKEGTMYWEALIYTIHSIIYGGRITDIWDQRTLTTLLKTYFKPEAFESNYKFSPSGTYYAPNYASLDEFQNYIESLPFMDDPEIFGLHENANLSYQLQETKTLMSTLVIVQPRITEVGAGSAKDIVAEIANTILEKLYTTIDIDRGLKSLFAVGKAGIPVLHLINVTKFQVDSLNRKKPTTVVLIQEIERFNRLILYIQDVTKTLIKAVKGMVIMDQTLEGVFNSLLLNQIPADYTKQGYPSVKFFGSYLKDFVLRIEFLEEWLTIGDPISFWISCFFFPQAFNTSILQGHARKYMLPIDLLAFDFTVLPQVILQQDLSSTVDNKTKNNMFEVVNSIVVPEDGAHIHGLFIEAARFDTKRMKLVDSHPREMYSPLPVVHLLPKLVYEFSLDPKDYTAPMYKTSLRFGTLSTTGHSTNYIMTIQIPTKYPPDFWIIRGTALLTQTTD